MTRAAVVYRSRTGTTRGLAEEIAAHLATRGIEARAVSIADCDPNDLPNVDLVIFGCWTNGLFVIAQHPDQPWVDFVRDLPVMKGPRIALFTTYKLVTGTMFKGMRAELAGKTSAVELELKSRGSHLGEGQRRALDRFAAGR